MEKHTIRGISQGVYMIKGVYTIGLGQGGHQPIHSIVETVLIRARLGVYMIGLGQGGHQPIHSIVETVIIRARLGGGVYDRPRSRGATDLAVDAPPPSPCTIESTLPHSCCNCPTSRSLRSLPLLLANNVAVTWVG